MTDEELVKEFTRVREVPEGFQMECQVIFWPHIHKPDSRWEKVKTLPPATPADVVAAVRRQLLRETRFFGVCEKCHERNPKGWMDLPALCSSCGERVGILH